MAELDFDWTAVEGFEQDPEAFGFGIDLDFFDVGGETVDGAPLIPPWANPANAEFFWNKPEFQQSPEALDAFSRFEAGTFDPRTASPGELVQVATALGIEVPAGLVTEPPGALPEAALQGMQQVIAENPVLQSVSYNTQTGQFVTADGQPVTPESNPGVWQQVKNAVGSLDKTLGESTLARMGGVLALGTLGILLGRAFSSDDRLRVPEPPPPTPAQASGQAALSSALTGALAPAGAGAPGATRAGIPGSAPGSVLPGSLVPAPFAVDPGRFFGPGVSGEADLSGAVRSGLAGQRNVADALMTAAGREAFTQSQQAPMESVARSIALSQIPGQMDRTLQTRIMNDPLLAAIYGQALSAVSGGRASPQLERQFQEEERAKRNQLYRDLGPGYETSTPGIQALAELAQRHNELRDLHSLRTVASFAPLALSRETFGENVRQTGLNENVNLSQNFGRTPLPQLTSQLNTIVPTMPLLGIDTAEQDRRLNQQLNNQLALAAFSSRQASDQALANSISGVAGSVAAQLGRSGGTTFRRNADGSFTLA